MNSRRFSVFRFRTAGAIIRGLLAIVLFVAYQGTGSPSRAEDVPPPLVSRESIRGALAYCRPTGMIAPKAICKTSPWTHSLIDNLTYDELKKPEHYQGNTGNWLNFVVVDPTLRNSDPPQIVDSNVVISTSDCSTEVSSSDKEKGSMAPSPKGSPAWKMVFRKCLRDHLSDSMSLLEANLSFEEQLWESDPDSPFLEVLAFLKSPSNSFELRGPKTMCYWELTEGSLEQTPSTQKLTSAKESLRLKDEALDRAERVRRVNERICEIPVRLGLNSKEECIKNGLEHPVEEEFQKFMDLVEENGLEPDEEACTATDTAGYVYDADTAILEMTQYLANKTLRMVADGPAARYANEQEIAPLYAAGFAIYCNAFKSYEYFVDHPDEMPEADDFPGYLLFDHVEQKPAYSLATDALAKAFFQFVETMKSLEEPKPTGTNVPGP